MNVHLAGGGALVFPRFGLPMFLQISQDVKARRMWVVPPVALALAKHPLVDEYDLSSIEQIFSGAAPLGKNSLTLWHGWEYLTLQGYGMTELSPVSHAVPANSPRAGSAGADPAKHANPDRRSRKRE